LKREFFWLQRAKQRNVENMVKGGILIEGKMERGKGCSWKKEERRKIKQGKNIFEITKVEVLLIVKTG